MATLPLLILTLTRSTFRACSRATIPMALQQLSFSSPLSSMRPPPHSADYRVLPVHGRSHPGGLHLHTPERPLASISASKEPEPAEPETISVPSTRIATSLQTLPGQFPPANLPRPISSPCFRPRFWSLFQTRSEPCASSPVSGPHLFRTLLQTRSGPSFQAMIRSTPASSAIDMA